MTTPSELNQLVDVVRRLRAPDGCPWDREQDHRTLRPYLLEETHEVLEAIDSGEPERLKAELGDLLLQVVMHAAIAEEAGQFDLAGVADGEAAKMVFRHPHVFGEVAVADAEEVLVNWERLKAAEREGKGSVLDGTPVGLPALARALALQKRAARVGLRWSEQSAGDDTLDALLGEYEAAVGQPQAEAALGRLLFALVNSARQGRLNPEDALRGETEAFAARFRAMEARAAGAGQDVTALDAEQIAQLWKNPS